MYYRSKLNDAPTLGKYNVFYPGSSVIGNCSLGDNVILGPGVQVVDRDVEDNTMLKLNDNHCIENYKLHKNSCFTVFSDLVNRCLTFGLKLI